ncbi:phage tail protein [Paraburkholderia sp. SIMBA_054]|uniref:phage tail protein n=1 Tax=Paraburkholderia sp. SIMBA_054 TaxID=3085795 RepID=UPI0039791A7C
MNTIRDLRTYRFAQSAQWAKGVLDRLENVDGRLQPSPHYGPVTREISDPHGVCLLWFRGITLTWLTGDGWIEWIDDCEDRQCRIEAPQAVREATRVIAGRRWLWAIAADQATISRLDAGTFDDAPTVSFADGLVRDAADDGHDGLWVLLGRATNTDALVHVHADGRIDAPLALPAAAAGALGLAYLGNAHHFVLLIATTRTLVYLDDEKANLVGTVKLDDALPGVTPERIASDGRDRVALIGSATANTAKVTAGTWALFDAFGALLTSVSSAALVGPDRNAAFVDIALRAASITVATPAGILVFEPVSSNGGQTPSGRYLTPVLYSPPTDVLRGWLRADLLATLPNGAAVTVTTLHTADPRAVAQVGAITADPTVTPGARIDAVVALLGVDANASIGYPLIAPDAASATENATTPQHYGFPLFGVGDPWIWLLIELHGAPDAPLPALAELRVLYPNVSLQQYVPAIFRGDATRQQQTIADPGGTRPVGDPTGFLRKLLGVLETSTQDLDQIIATLGRVIHPRYAQGAWLDFIAQWMDLPWDDVLPEAIKRRIVTNTATLLGARGTRVGLIALLGALLPTARIRVLDANSDMRLARLVGPKVQGATLPAILTGLPADTTALSRRAILGAARLPCPGDPDPTGRFLGVLRIDIDATLAERQALQPILPTLIEAMIPAGLHIVIRWLPVSPASAAGTDDMSVRLTGPGPGQLGCDAVLGRLILAGRHVNRLSESGILPGFRLH